MDAIEELSHSVLQKLIMIFLGLLTLGIVLQSCTYHKPCSAYDNVELANPEFEE